MKSDLYIWIPNWDGHEGFQHYKERDPIWIKNYTRLLSHDAYGDLSYHLRGILHSLWMEYARSDRRLPGNTLTLTRRLGHRVLTRDLEALKKAGFVELLASTTLAVRLQDASPHARPGARERREETQQERQEPINKEPSPQPEPELHQDSDRRDNGAGTGGGDLERINPEEVLASLRPDDDIPF